MLNLQVFTKFRGIVFPSVTAFALLAALCTPARADYITTELGAAGPGNFAFLALTGANDIALNGPGSTTGNVGISSGTLSLNGSAGPEVNGNVLLASGASIQTGNGTQVTGTVSTNQNLTQANTDARNAAAAFAALTPTQTVAGGQINGTVIINGVAGINVINVNSINLGNGQTLTLNGPAGSEFIINDTGNLVLNSGKILETGGVAMDDVVINDTSSGNAVSSSGGLNNESILDGILLATNSGIAFAPGAVNGEVIAGGSTIHFVSGAGVTKNSGPPPGITPEPSTLFMLGTGLLGLGGLMKRKRLA